jgi:DNA (cytosine-5)-methyltransferase 1
LYVSETDVTSTLTKAGIGTNVAQPIPLDTMTIQGRPSDVKNKMGMGIGQPGDPSFTLTKGHSHAVAQPKAYLSTRGVVRELNNVMSTLDAAGESRGTNQQRFLMQPIAFSSQMSQPQIDVDMTQTLQAKNPMAVSQHMAVRRLTPKECERLQGFPDNYTDIQPKGKPTPDGPRYKALGNSMAVPVMAWIGQRIEQVEAICKQNK